MKIHVLSDLHLEFASFSPPETDADVIVLAGDIGVGDESIRWAKEMFGDSPVIYVPGNHEYYDSDMSETFIAMQAEAKATGINLLDNDAVVIDGVRFLGTTLWTDFRLHKEERKVNEGLSKAKSSITDFFAISYGGAGRFLPEHSVALHFEALKWLQGEIRAPFGNPTVVVTHHCPHRLSVPRRFSRDVLTAAFATDLDHLMGDPINLWIHGHTHDSFDYTVRGTRVVCNPRGYSQRGRNENKRFNPALVVEV